MAKKKASPTKEQAEVLARNSLNRLTWEVIQDLNFSMIVRNRATGEIRVIDK